MSFFPKTTRRTKAPASPKQIIQRQNFIKLGQLYSLQTNLKQFQKTYALSLNIYDRNSIENTLDSIYNQIKIIKHSNQNLKDIKND